MERKAFFERAEKRLGRPMPKEPPARDAQGVPECYRRRSLGVAPDSEVDLAKKFRAELEALGGQLFIEEGPGGAGERLRTLLQRLQPGQMVSWAREEFMGWPLDWLWDEAGCLAWPGEDAAPALRTQWRAAAPRADIGFTTAECAVADTGTLLLTSGPGRPRAASLLPDTHVALVRPSQLVARLGDALPQPEQELYPGVPSACLFITGPSRTSDIENDLTIGVHGPGQLIVVIG